MGVTNRNGRRVLGRTDALAFEREDALPRPAKGELHFTGPIPMNWVEQAAFWRIDRITRYETACIRAAVDEVDDPTEPNRFDPLTATLSDSKPLAVRLEEVVKERDGDRGYLAETEDGLRVLLSPADAAKILFAEEGEFSYVMGWGNDMPHDVAWTLGHLRQSPAWYADEGWVTFEKLIARTVRRHR